MDMPCLRLKSSNSSLPNSVDHPIYGPTAGTSAIIFDMMFLCSCVFRVHLLMTYLVVEPARKDNIDKLPLLYGSLQSDAEDRQHIEHHHV